MLTIILMAGAVGLFVGFAVLTHRAERGRKRSTDHGSSAGGDAGSSYSDGDGGFDGAGCDGGGGDGGGD